MKLLGSRASGTGDDYSDWDHAIEGAGDFATLRPMLDDALCWRCQKLGPLMVLTLITPDFSLHDYTDESGLHEAEWKEIQARETDTRIAEFWILAFKHLKAIHREYWLLLDCGIELSAQILRDKFVENRFGSSHYRDFFAHKRLGENVSEKCAPLFDVTGMPTHTRAERIDKLLAINALYASLTPNSSETPRAGAEAKLLALRE